MKEIKVKRNGKTNRIGYAREFKKQSREFQFTPLHDIIESIRSYEKDGCFKVEDDYITIIHFC